MREMLLPLRANPDNNFKLELDVSDSLSDYIVYGFEIKNGQLMVAVQKYKEDIEDDILVEEYDEEEPIEDLVDLFR